MYGHDGQEFEPSKKVLMSLTITAYDCPLHLGAFMADSTCSAWLAGAEVFLRVDSSIDSADHRRDGYGLTTYLGLENIEVDPTPAAWSIFEQAVLVCAQRRGELDPDEPFEYSAGFHVVSTQAMYFQNEENVELMKEACLHKYGATNPGYAVGYRRLPIPEDLTLDWVRV